MVVHFILHHLISLLVETKNPPLQTTEPMASPLDGLQSFLHGLPDFSSPEALSPHQLNQATEIFVFSVIQFEPLQANHREEYDYITLLRTIYQLVAVPDSFLRLLFSFIVREEYFSRDDSVVPYPDLAQALSRFSDSTLSNELQKSLAAFADHLVEYFFLPRTEHRIPRSVR